MTAREACDTIVLSAAGLFIATAIVASGLGFCSIIESVRADGWAFNPNNSAVISQWFATLMQPDHPAMSCCGVADAFEADNYEVKDDHYIAIITDGRGEIPTGSRIEVPNTKIKWDAGNPTGHGIIFLSGALTMRPGQDYVYVTVGDQTRILYCYIAPTGI